MQALCVIGLGVGGHFWNADADSHWYLGAPQHIFGLPALDPLILPLRFPFPPDFNILIFAVDFSFFCHL